MNPNKNIPRTDNPLAGFTQGTTSDSFESEELSLLSERAWLESRNRHGNRLSVHVPGMFVVNGRRGKYRAVSITGNRCELDCEHCKGTLLKTMPHAEDSRSLLRLGLEAAARGDFGLLVTGGCDEQGRLPWKGFLQAIRLLKARTDLTITVHSGQVDSETAAALKESGVDQALVDVIGDDATAREVYHLAGGVRSIQETLDALAAAELEIVPHVLYGLYYGKERGEQAALEILKQYPLNKYVVVVVVPKKGTPMSDISVPSPSRVAAFLAEARLKLPNLKASLGCARPRGHYGRALDVLAVKAGVNSLALPSDRALEEAQVRGLDVVYKETCCSLG
ncbi:MAG: radical SAM protein [Desulfomonile tiedjei]|nr:radical SAM protein [Desulfomonile tiedjei]